MENFFIGVDVGTSSVRAGLFNQHGELINHSEKKIQIWNYNNDYYEQSSEDIWNSCKKVIKDIIVNVEIIKIQGIGFDATCSLVCLDKNKEPLSVSFSGDNNRNVILWMDHRAKKETEFINSIGHPILKYVGGKISLEMEIPKLLWLKNNLSSTWEKAGYFFDLPDFLTWKATGYFSRSLCSLVCKWNYEVLEDRNHNWNEDFLNKINLLELLEKNSEKIGREVLTPGTPVGNGLLDKIGLLPGTPVGSSLIDAHAGGFGMIGSAIKHNPEDISKVLCVISGTSTCHMIVNEKPIFVPGVWGPYFSAMVPNFWLNEGGQSASGKLIDFILESHPVYNEINQKSNQMNIQEYLSKVLIKLADKKNLKNIAYLTKDLHVWPDYHGNRSPIADPYLKGMINGLTLSNTEEDLAILYLATIQALSYGTLHIINRLIESGYKNGISKIIICGGLTKNSMFIQTLADVCCIEVLRPKQRESVLLGAAMLGACASKRFENVLDIFKTMSSDTETFSPNKQIREYHLRKYKVFLRMLNDQYEYNRIMNS